MQRFVRLFSCFGCQLRTVYIKIKKVLGGTRVSADVSLKTPGASQRRAICRRADSNRVTFR